MFSVTRSFENLSSYLLLPLGVTKVQNPQMRFCFDWLFKYEIKNSFVCLVELMIQWWIMGKEVLQTSMKVTYLWDRNLEFPRLTESLGHVGSDVFPANKGNPSAVLFYYCLVLIPFFLSLSHTHTHTCMHAVQTGWTESGSEQRKWTHGTETQTILCVWVRFKFVNEPEPHTHTHTSLCASLSSCLFCSDEE